MSSFGRREFLKRVGVVGAALGILPLEACATGKPGGKIDPPTPEDQRRLSAWASKLSPPGVRFRRGPLGWSAAAVGEMAIGTPYEAFTLEQYLKAGGDPVQQEPLALSLTKFDCVTLIEACLAVARISRKSGKPSWGAFADEIERMRYRGGLRLGFASRLHYFSEWISDGEKRGLVRDLGKELEGNLDSRPLRFMTEHRASYPGLKNDSVFREIGNVERALDTRARYVIPTDRISLVSDKIQSGDVLAFATSIAGLDVTHAAFAYREKTTGPLRVLHAPLSGGSVEISQRSLSDYVTAIKRSTGILVARPLD